MQTIAISDQHHKWLQKKATERKGPSVKADTILSELLDELMEAERTTA